MYILEDDAFHFVPFDLEIFLVRHNGIYPLFLPQSRNLLFEIMTHLLCL